MTSRIVDCSQYRTIGLEILTSPDQKECVKLLFKAVGILVTERFPYARAAKNIIDDLGFYTLAIIQAGAYIARNHYSMKEFLKKFRFKKARLLQCSPEQANLRYSHDLQLLRHLSA